MRKMRVAFIIKTKTVNDPDASENKNSLFPNDFSRCDYHTYCTKRYEINSYYLSVC